MWHERHAWHERPPPCRTRPRAARSTGTRHNRLPRAAPSLTFLRMRFLPLLLGMVILGGCTQPAIDEPPPAESSLFGPTAMRIHPIFTQIKDFTGDGSDDGIEVLLEFQDQFGDPTKASGTVMFELYDYRQGNAEMRGQRLSNPWMGSINTVNEQKVRWNRTSRTYTFQLSYPSISRFKSYVLTATFRSNAGGRFSDKIVLKGEETPTTKPTTKPASPFGM